MLFLFFVEVFLLGEAESHLEVCVILRDDIDELFGVSLGRLEFLDFIRGKLLGVVFQVDLLVITLDSFEVDDLVVTELLLEDAFRDVVELARFVKFVECRVAKLGVFVKRDYVLLAPLEFSD